MYWFCFCHAVSIKSLQCVYVALDVLVPCKSRLREIRGILLRKLMPMCGVCKKRNGDMRRCVECKEFACSDHWLRCEDPKCMPYYRICLNCQREPRFALWRTKDPKAIWVCQTCAKEARHSLNFMCDLCGEHHARLRTCRACDKSVCQRDHFWCSVKNCSYSLCRNCNEDSPSDIQKIDGIWSCRWCRESGKAQAHRKTKKFKKHCHQHWKQGESWKAQAHIKTKNSNKHSSQHRERRKTW